MTPTHLNQLIKESSLAQLLADPEICKEWWGEEKDCTICRTEGGRISMAVIHDSPNCTLKLGHKHFSLQAFQLLQQDEESAEEFILSTAI